MPCKSRNAWAWAALSTPAASMVATSDDPPKETNGSGIPVSGATARTAAASSGSGTGSILGPPAPADLGKLMSGELVSPPRLKNAAIPKGHDYDACDANVLLNRVSVKDGRLVYARGFGTADGSAGGAISSGRGPVEGSSRTRRLRK